MSELHNQWRFVVITGNPIDGFTFYGPFPTQDNAAGWGDEYVKSKGEAYWVEEMLEP